MKIIVAKGKVGRSKVNVYGEIHNDIDNSFYESLNLEDHLLLVEHASVFCEIKPGEEHLFENAKGSEWVFKNHYSKGNLICVDLRLEYGFLNGYEEKELPTLPVKDFLQKVKKALTAFVVNKEMYSAIDDLYDDFIETIQKETLIVAYLSSTSKTVLLDNQPVDKDLLLSNVRHILTKNIIKLSGISIDLFIASVVHSQESSKPISVFVGMNHAMRLAKLLKLKIIKSTDTPIDPSWEPLGDPQVEAEILSQFRNKK